MLIIIRDAACIDCNQQHEAVGLILMPAGTAGVWCFSIVLKAHNFQIEP